MHPPKKVHTKASLAPAPVSWASSAPLLLTRPPCPPPPGPWLSGPSTHLWGRSPSSAPASQAWSPSSCVSAGTMWRSCPVWQRASRSASRSANTSSVAAGGTAPLSTTAWPSLALCWTKVHVAPVMAFQAEVAAQGCACSRVQPSFPLSEGGHKPLHSPLPPCLTYAQVWEQHFQQRGQCCTDLITVSISHVGPFQCSPTLEGAPDTGKDVRERRGSSCFPFPKSNYVVPRGQD